MFRSFVYLDDKKMYEYLRLINKSYLNISFNESRETSANFGCKTIGAGVSAKSIKNTEHIQDITNDYDQFEKDLTKKNKDSYFDFTTTDYDLLTVPNMCIIRLYDFIKIPEKFDMLNLIKTFGDLFVEMQDNSKTDKEILKSFLGNSSADIPFILKKESYTVYGKMKTDYLSEEYTDLEEYENQEIFLLCKVISKNENKQVKIFDPLKDFLKFNRALRRGMNNDNKDLQPIVIDGPVVKVEPIAIYK